MVSMQVPSLGSTTMTPDRVLALNEKEQLLDETVVREKKSQLVESIMSMARFCFTGLFSARKPTEARLAQLEQTIVTRVLDEVGPELDIAATKLNPIVSRTAHQLVIAGDAQEVEN